MGISEHAWRVDQVSGVETSFARPAKGPGYVEIGVHAGETSLRGETLISTKAFDQKILKWARQILAAFYSAAVPTKEIDEGYDA